MGPELLIRITTSDQASDVTRLSWKVMGLLLGLVASSLKLFQFSSHLCCQSCPAGGVPKRSRRSSSCKCCLCSVQLPPFNVPLLPPIRAPARTRWRRAWR